MNIAAKLSHDGYINKRAAGIEPASSAWKAEVLPLNYARTKSKNHPVFKWMFFSTTPLLPCAPPKTA